MSQLMQYLFDLYAGAPNLLFWRSVIGLAIAQIVVAIISIFIQKSRDKFVRHLAFRLLTWGFFSGPVILLLAWFRFQNLYLLSMRFWIMTWLVVAGIWLLRIAKWWVVDVPRARSQRQIRQKFQKYLPR